MFWGKHQDDKEAVLSLKEKFYFKIVVLLEKNKVQEEVGIHGAKKVATYWDWSKNYATLCLLDPKVVVISRQTQDRSNPDLKHTTQNYPQNFIPQVQEPNIENWKDEFIELYTYPSQNKSTFTVANH